MSDILIGLNLPTSAAEEADPVALAVEAEELGFDFVSANDHPAAPDPSFEVWTLLAWVAAKTTRISLATRVLGVPFRAPAMVAKMAESLDRLSDGRLILGMGGGSSDEEFRAFGLGLPTPREKIDGLDDALHIIRGLWSRQRFTFEGARYGTERATLEPKPSHHIPIWLGTLGPRGLDLAGRLADGWIPSYELAPPERARVMRDRIRRAASAAGRDPDEIRCVYNLEVRVDPEGSQEPAVISGRPDEITERLVDLVQLGFTGFNFIPRGPDQAEQRALLAREVLPALRGQSGRLSSPV